MNDNITTCIGLPVAEQFVTVGPCLELADFCLESVGPFLESAVLYLESDAPCHRAVRMNIV